MPTRPPWRDALNVWNLDFGLHRRVIEIRDARLLLRPYLDPRVAGAAEDLGRRQGLPDEDLCAVVEAASLAAAVRAKTQGYPAPTETRPVPPPGGTDLESETGWLAKEGAACAHSPLVLAVLLEQQAEQRAAIQQQRTSLRR